MGSKASTERPRTFSHSDASSSSAANNGGSASGNGNDHHHGSTSGGGRARSYSSSIMHNPSGLLELSGRINSLAGFWPISGVKCPICSKSVQPDDIEVHLVMCLTKPRITYNEDRLVESKEEECVICLEELEAGQTIARLPCLCIYHKECIDKWFQVNRSCPEHPND